MTNSKLWQDLEAQFRALDPYGLLRADGTYTVGSSNVSSEMLYQWALRGEMSLAVGFRVLAHKAGAALGRSDLDPFIAWLQDLTTEHRFFRIETTGGVEQRADGTIVRHFVLATINNICQASAHRCVSLQLAALEAEHLANYLPQPSNRITVPVEVPPRDLEAASASPESGINQTTEIEPSAHTHSAPPGKQRDPIVRKPSRRNPKYSAIDKALQEIADSKPKSHQEVFHALDNRVDVPHAEPFVSARGWHVGFKKDANAARAWLSKRWTHLNLTPFLRGPK
jgi:hypothetical protein